MGYNQGSFYPYGGVVADQPADVRANFIMRVYGLLFASLLVTVAVGVMAAAYTPVLIGAWPVLAIAGLVCGIVLAFARRTAGWNLVMFGVYSVIQGLIMGPVLTVINQFAPGVPMLAAVVTLAVFGGLSLYVLISRQNFSFLGGFLFIALIGLIVVGLVGFFIKAAILSMVYSVAGVLIFSGFVLYDTSRIIHDLEPGEAISGAVSLYVDFLNLFWFILRLFLRRE